MQNRVVTKMKLHSVPVQSPAAPFPFGQNISDQTLPFRATIRCKNTFHNSDTLTTSSTQANRMFILGMGFVGQFFATDLKNKGWLVSGTCTSIAKQKKLEDLGLNAFVFDANDPQPDILDIVSYHTHLLISIPPVVGGGDPMLQHRELLESRLKGGNLQWLSYLSSTRKVDIALGLPEKERCHLILKEYYSSPLDSVYGDYGGAWVDEDCLARPMSESARARLAAEVAWLNLGSDLDVAAQVFRLGGIYGPGRSAIDTIIKQEALSKTQKMRSSRQYTSRIHAADICQALNASIQRPSPGRIYNLVDDDPAPRVEVFAYARSLVEKKWPGHLEQCTVPESAESTVLKGGYRGEKRVSNARMKNELGVKLLHPTYRSGLQGIIEHMDNPFAQKSSV